MQTFTIGLGHSWWRRIWGGHPLVRRSDRIEAFAVILAVLTVIVATPIAGAIGTAVHDTRTRLYAQEAQSKHQATVTAIENSAIVAHPSSVSFTARAKWRAAGRDHVETIEWPDRAKAGEQQDIWVDNQGNQTAPPSPPSRADADGVGSGLAVWLAVAVAAAGFVVCVRCAVDRWRYAEWDREISAAADDDGGRTNH